MSDSSLPAVAPAVAFAGGCLDWPATDCDRWYFGSTEAPTRAVVAPSAATSSRAADPAALFDVASLTKVLATTTLAARAVEQGRVRWDTPTPDGWVEGATLGDLLAHRGGLPAWTPLYASAEASAPTGDLVDAALRARRRAQAGARVAAQPIDHAPAGRYSDLGYWVLGWWLERLWDAPLEELFEREVATPLGVQPSSAPPTVGAGTAPRMGYLPVHPGDPAWSVATVPTEVYDDPAGDDASFAGYRPLRRAAFAAGARPVARGEVHDDNAWWLGGVAGHAGVFAELAAVERWARAWLGDGTLPVSDRLRREVLGWQDDGGGHGLGFDRATPGGTTGGVLDPDARGHLGYSGCSVWLEPSRGAFHILLSNAVCPVRARTANALRTLRLEVHAASAGRVRSRGA